MEQLQKIKTWLENNNRDFFEGIGLLSQVCRNKTLIRNLSRSQSRYNFEKLINELKKEARVPAKIIPPPNTSAASVPDTFFKVSDKRTEDLNTAAPAPSAAVVVPMTLEETKAAVEKLEVSLARMHNKKGMLSNSLREFDASDNDGRKKVLDQIDGLNSDMNDIRVKLAYYQKHGTLPPIPAEQSFEIRENEIPDDPVDMKQMLLNERSNRAKLKKKIDNPDTDKNKLSELEARFASKEILISEIERRLNGSN